jgi:voltage-gated potassium channel
MTDERAQAGMDERSERIAARLQAPIMVAALLTIPALVIIESHPGGWLETAAVTLNWLIWLSFCAELAVMLAVVPDWRAWLRRHPLEVLIVILTPPFLPPALQGLRVFVLLRLVRVAQLSREVFSLDGLRYAALLALLTILAGGGAFDALEPDLQLNGWQSIYWSITTMTTLGSSIQPTTTGGEIVSATVLIVGIGFVALLTGAVAQRFLGPQIADAETELESPSHETTLRRLDELQAQMRAMEASLERIARHSPGG